MRWSTMYNMLEHILLLWNVHIISIHYTCARTALTFDMRSGCGSFYYSGRPYSKSAKAMQVTLCTVFHLRWRVGPNGSHLRCLVGMLSVCLTVVPQNWFCLALFLQEPHSAQHAFSAEQHHSVYHTYPIPKFMTQHWTNMSKMPEFSSMQTAIQAGLNSLCKFHDLANKLDANLACLGMICQRCFNTLWH